MVDQAEKPAPKALERESTSSPSSVAAAGLPFQSAARRSGLPFGAKSKTADPPPLEPAGFKWPSSKGATLIATNPISPFMVPIKVTMLAALMLALPVVLYQIWAFVAPGLYAHEKRLVLPLIISSTVLFFAGVAFCYFFVFGKVFTFIQSFAPKSITAAPDIEAYLSFVLNMFLAFGAAFEVPVVLVILARMGIVSVDKFKSFRSYFIVVAFVIAAVITPPDVVSQLSLAIPMCLLYEVGIWAAQLFVKHTRAPESEDAPAS